MKFVREDTIVIDGIIPMYFVKNKLRTEYEKIFADGYDKWLDEFMGGWGNGYVALPFWHPYYEMDYDKIPVNIHGGLTFSILDDTTDLWVIGFDSNHSGDNLHNRSFEWLKEETRGLLIQW